MKPDGKEEVLTPQVEVLGEQKKNNPFVDIIMAYLKEAWDALILPALKEFWKEHSKEVLENAKTLLISLIKGLVTKKGEEKK